jgi:hypothetical protein
MPVNRRSPDTWPLEVLDRVLDHGIQIDAPRQEPGIGLGLLTIESHVHVTQLETWLTHELEPPARAA